jgi:hypothetical protein
MDSRVKDVMTTDVVSVSARQRDTQIPLLGVASMASRRAESGEPDQADVAPPTPDSPGTPPDDDRTAELPPAVSPGKSCPRLGAEMGAAIRRQLRSDTVRRRHRGPTQML